ncbi:uncharacterized protein C11orf24 homolog [Cavia porcellus]|uniref:uncharacterized protein C11orf24 homolog n=1 Tax=Cavia porcellus TaxID=10141 RepID=UPI000184D9F3|nr:uncharacterized protein C11orf24 homolog [Cavia porcellus]
MWTALMLVWIFSLSLSASQVASDKPRYLIPNEVLVRVVKKNNALETKVPSKRLEKTTTVTPSLVKFTEGTLTATLSPTKVTAETTHRTNVSTLAAVEGVPETVSSGAATPFISPIPTSVWQTPAATVPGLPSLSTPRAQVPSTSTSQSTAATVRTLTTSNQTAAANANSSSSTLSSSEPTPTSSTASPTSTVGTQAQGPTSPVSQAQPVLSTAGRSTSAPSNITPEVTTPPSMAPVSSTAVTTTQAQAEESTTSTVPAPPSSPTPQVEATSPTTPPPVSSTHGAGGPATPQTSEQMETKATPGTASATPGVTPRSSGEPKVPGTDLCQPSTEGQYLVVTTEPLSPSSVDKTPLLVVLILGVTLFATVLVLFALQAYESYKKKDYTQVDYLINGMYADSEM